MHGVTHQSTNPKAKKQLCYGPMTCKPVQKNKSRAPAKRIMMNKGPTFPKGAKGFIPHSDGLAY
jgi:hypothetical protein